MRGLLDVSSVSTPLSGIGRYSLELARHLRNQEELTELCYLVGGSITSNFNVDLQAIAPLRKSGRLRQLLKKVIPEQRLLRPYRKWKTARLARDLCSYEDYIFHSPNFSLPPFRGKSVVTMHDLSVFHYPQYHPRDRVSFLREQIHESVEHADMLVTDSEFVRSELIALFGVAASRVRAVPLGVDPIFRPRAGAQLQDCLGRYGLTNKGYLLSVGTLEPRKNLAGLLRAYLRIEPSLRKSNPLVIVGAIGWGSDTLLAEIEALVQSGDILYLRYVPERDLPSIYSGATTFCYMSFYEGFGLPVLEAMSSGVPVICSDSSSLPEVCGAAAMLVDVNDEQAVTSALRRALIDTQWREQSITSGLYRSEGYRWETTARQLTALYASLVSA